MLVIASFIAASLLGNAPSAVSLVPGAAFAPPGSWQLRLVESRKDFEVFQLTFPSLVRTPYPENNTVCAFYYALRTSRPRPAVVVLHAYKEKHSDLERKLCRVLIRRGMNCLLVVLPYHFGRTPPGVRSGELFVTSDLDHTAESLRQSAADTILAVSWLRQRREVDAGRIGLVGISLGAIVCQLVMGVDRRISAGVALLGGGDLGEILWNSIATVGVKQRLLALGISKEQVRRKLAVVDPLSYAKENYPRRVLMINAARDTVVPTSCALRLWNELGRPPIIWLNTNHFGFAFAADKVFRVCAGYLAVCFEGGSRSAESSGVSVLPVKLGAVFGLGRTMNYVLAVELIPLVRRSLNRSWVYAGAMLTGTGAYATLGATPVGDFDFGAALRLTDGPRKLTGYAMLTFVF
ncbi:MAG: alpha/beta hydrolase family protein [Armatimonadota bacterium]